MSNKESHRGVWLVKAIDLVGFYFPGLLLLLELAVIYRFVSTPSIAGLALVCVVPYAVPLFLFRLMMLIAPLKEGREYLDRGKFSPWFIAYRLQVIYGLLPFLEGILLAFPGLFSFWLRCWGSRIGKNVFWAATVKVADRSHMTIGDNVFVGNEAYFSPHVVKRGRERNLLYYKGITIEDDCFIGAGSRMGPGVVIRSGAQLPALTVLYLNEEFPAVCAAQ